MNPTPSETEPAQLGEILVRQGLLSPNELQAALAFRRDRGVKLGQALVALHLVTQQDISDAVRRQGAWPSLELAPEEIDRELARRLPAALARQLTAIPVRRVEGRITVAMEDPGETIDVDALALALGGPVRAVHADPERIRTALDAVWGSASSPAEAHGTFQPSGSAEEEIERALRQARAQGAEALHVTPFRSGTEIALRVGGSAARIALLERERCAPLVERLAELARLAPGARHGRAPLWLDGEQVELEVNLLAVQGGTCATARVHISPPPPALGELGLELDARELLGRAALGSGLVLIAGPRGSAREATAGALLAEAAQAGRRVAAWAAHALPVDGALVLHPGPAKGERLADLLEQEPDVLYVDRVGGRADLRRLLDAALCGRLVLARVDARDAAAAAWRLARASGDPSLAAEALRASVAQRRLRLLCADCRRPAEGGFEPAGCARCHHSGWARHGVLYEVLDFEGPLEAVLAGGADARELRSAARALGFPALRETAADLARAGETTRAEVERVLAQS
jgi:type II secretory ATPase GspE/PulE/Tfp pilus assembly ATPase PilB-like protein